MSEEDQVVEKEDQAQEEGGTDLVAIATAAINGGMDEISAVYSGLSDLKSKYTNAVFDVTTTAGMDEAKEARAAVRDPRYKVERIRKDSKRKLAAIGKEIDKEAEYLTVQLFALEAPIDAQIKAEEKRKDDERAKKVEAERQRQLGIRSALNAISELPAITPRTIVALEMSISSLESCEPGESVFQEHLEHAIELHSKALATLRNALADEKDQEARRAEMARQQDELDRQRKLIDEERRKEREAVERARVINERIRGLRQLGKAGNATSGELEARIKSLDGIKVDYETYGEMTQDALEAIADARESLAAALPVAVEREAQAALRAYNAAEADKKARIEREEAEAKRKAEEAEKAAEAERKKAEAAEAEVKKREQAIADAWACRDALGDKALSDLMASSISAYAILPVKTEAERKVRWHLRLALIQCGTDPGE